MRTCDAHLRPQAGSSETLRGRETPCPRSLRLPMAASPQQGQEFLRWQAAGMMEMWGRLQSLVLEGDQEAQRIVERVMREATSGSDTDRVMALEQLVSSGHLDLSGANAFNEDDPGYQLLHKSGRTELARGLLAASEAAAAADAAAEQPESRRRRTGAEDAADASGLRLDVVQPGGESTESLPLSVAPPGGSPDAASAASPALPATPEAASGSPPPGEVLAKKGLCTLWSSPLKFKENPLGSASADVEPYAEACANKEMRRMSWALLRVHGSDVRQVVEELLEKLKAKATGCHVLGAQTREDGVCVLLNKRPDTRYNIEGAVVMRVPSSALAKRECALRALALQSLLRFVLGRGGCF